MTLSYHEMLAPPELERRLTDMTPTFRIAVIPGDGIGKEVMPEGQRVLDAAAERFGLALDYRVIEWASCDYYAAHGQMMPDDWKAQLEGGTSEVVGSGSMTPTAPAVDVKSLHAKMEGALTKAGLLSAKR